MAPKKNSISAFLIYMTEIQKSLAGQGIKKSMSDMPNYCHAGWEKMPYHIKDEYKIKAKQMKRKKFENLTSLRRDEEDGTPNNQCFSVSMYSYIGEIVSQKPTRHFIPKHNFILIHINSYSCEKDSFYFPAEITLAEFSLEKGLIRMCHELLGFDKIKTFAPMAPTADINIHAKNNHHITTFKTLPSDYKSAFLKLISKYYY